MTDPISDWVSVIEKDYKKLGVRIKTVNHTILCKHKRVILRAHYPAFRASKPTINDLVNLLDSYIVNFSLPRVDIMALHAKYKLISAEEYDAERDKIRDKARDLFIKANKATHRNGEAGELLLYLLTEWILQAPQIIAKMSLKTNSSMPVYGSDGVHVRYKKLDGSLEFLWGESKLHKNVNGAIDSAIASLKKALSEKEINFELSLVSRYVDFSGMSQEAKDALLLYLDPLSENSNKIVNTVTCLIGFDFDGYALVAKEDSAEVDKKFCAEIISALHKASDKLGDMLTKEGLDSENMEIFFFPMPSVSDFRDLFQDKIGWIS